MSAELIERLRAETIRSYLRGSRRGMTLREIIEVLSEEIRGQGAHRPDWADQPNVVRNACCHNWQYDGVWHTCRYSRNHESIGAGILHHACVCGRRLR